VSWQPMHEKLSPGMAVYQLRMSWMALPSASSGCTATGVLAQGDWLNQPLFKELQGFLSLG